jgi:hypothetical protein
MQLNQDIIYNNMFETRKYLIFPTSQLDNIDFTQVGETSKETVRKSIDETKTFVKWDGSDPTFISELTNTEGPYNHKQILQILLTPEWSSDINEQ